MLDEWEKRVDMYTSDGKGEAVVREYVERLRKYSLSDPVTALRGVVGLINAWRGAMIKDEEIKYGYNQAWLSGELHLWGHTATLMGCCDAELAAQVLGAAIRLRDGERGRLSQGVVEFVSASMGSIEAINETLTGLGEMARGWTAWYMACAPDEPVVIERVRRMYE